MLMILKAIHASIFRVAVWVRCLHIVCTENTHDSYSRYHSFFYGNQIARFPFPSAHLVESCFTSPIVRNGWTGPILAPLSFRKVEKWSNKVADIKAHIKLVPSPRLKPSNIIATNHNWIENKNKKIDRYVYKHISVQIYEDLYLGVYLYTCVAICVKYKYGWRHKYIYTCIIHIHMYMYVYTHYC